MPTPNEGFVTSVRAYDPLLSVRWGNYIKRWVVERKAVITETELWFLSRRTARIEKWMNEDKRTPSEKARLTGQFKEISEELTSAKSGKRVVMMPKELNTLAFNVLCSMDIQRWGGYSRMADELERKDAAREKDEERMMSNERRALGAHTFDVLDFLWRKRSSELASGSYRTKTLKELLDTSEV